MTLNVSNENKLQDIFCASEFEDSETRLSALNALNLLDSPAELVFDRITSLGARLFNVPVCMVTLVDRNRIYFKSKVHRISGLPTHNISRKLNFCAYTIKDTAPDVFIVNRTKEHPLFKENYLVTTVGVQFYAGAPLTLSDGIKLGAFCIMDLKPHDQITIEEKMSLLDLASMAVAQIEIKRELQKVHLTYISSTAHNLRTPLTCLDLSLMDLKDSIEDKEAWGRAKTNVELMKYIVEKGITLAKAHYFLNGAHAANPTNIVVTQLINRVMQTIAAFPKSVNITYVIDDSCPESIETDDMALFQSLIDLLTNSCKFTTQGYIQVKFSSTEEEGKVYIVVEVSDTGCGIPKEVKELLFVKPFIQGNEKNVNGLGCYNVRLNMELIHGTYAVLDNVPQGAKFVLKFPNLVFSAQLQGSLVSTAEKSSPSQLSFSVSDTLHSSAQTIKDHLLVVDDCAPIRILLQRLLQKAGFENVDFAENGEEGLSKLKKEEFAIAFIDFLMPIMGGLQCIELYREWEEVNREKRTVIIGISANAEVTDVEHGMEVGMDYFVQKPINVDKIQELLEKAISKNIKVKPGQNVKREIRIRKSTSKQKIQKQQVPQSVQTKNQLMPVLKVGLCILVFIFVVGLYQFWG